MVIKAKLAETSTPSLAPRSSSTTPFSLRNLVNASLISRLSQAVDQIENRLKQNRPWKVVTVRRGLKEDPDAARDRHFAAHPEDKDADVVIFHFYDEGNGR